MVLSDLGAEVVKIEKPGAAGLEGNRRHPPLVDGQSLYFSVYNRGKKSVCLDLRHDDGKAVLRELVARSDIVVENFRPGTIAAMGFGYEALCEIKPDIILVSVSGFGQYGPYRDRPAFDSLGQAMCGLMMLNGQAEGHPVPTASSIVDRVTALNATIGALAAMRHRDLTGRGQHVDVCLLDSALTLVEIPTSYYMSTGQEGGETRRPVYRTKDGWVVIAANNLTVGRLMEAVGVEGDRPASVGLFPNPPTAGTTVGTRNPLGDTLVTWCVERTTAEIVGVLSDHDVPCAPVATTADVADDPHLHEREMLIPTPDSIASELYLPGLSIKFSEATGGIGPVPELGEHTEQVLHEWLGYEPSRIEALRASGAAG